MTMTSAHIVEILGRRSPLQKAGDQVGLPTTGAGKPVLPDTGRKSKKA